jgi:6-phosphogluconate dehydrogenase (decarboxylating)
MLFIDEFTEDLSNFIESLVIENGNNKPKKIQENWRDQLRTKIRTLADHYGGGNIGRDRGPSFVIGDGLLFFNKYIIQYLINIFIGFTDK